MNIKHCDNENKSTNFISENQSKTETININGNTENFLRAVKAKGVKSVKRKKIPQIQIIKQPKTYKLKLNIIPIDVKSKLLICKSKDGKLSPILVLPSIQMELHMYQGTFT